MLLSCCQRMPGTPGTGRCVCQTAQTPPPAVQIPVSLNPGLIHPAATNLRLLAPDPHPTPPAPHRCTYLKAPSQAPHAVTSCICFCLPGAPRSRQGWLLRSGAVVLHLVVVAAPGAVPRVAPEPRAPAGGQARERGLGGCSDGGPEALRGAPGDTHPRHIHERGGPAGRRAGGARRRRRQRWRQRWKRQRLRRQ